MVYVMVGVTVLVLDLVTVDVCVGVLVVVGV
jgi:hypothetical protein